MDQCRKYKRHLQLCKFHDPEYDFSSLELEQENQDFNDVDFPLGAYGYLLGRTAADVSIFLRFNEDMECASQINIVDLDTKPISKFNKWAKERRDMSKAF